ncbi:sugar transferase (plasmid) [Peteryoungia desertarenae]|uniref:Sugar transferase n=1 Tax=Peteryoungia desertarenae TaxID=1813451 RepID=A0ABX6QTW7_9HYPH|nr:sugar transferase [Peteryoungia desertarenae]QLF71737.1 sugar transferase [Peteryoungia desertarenae]
MLKRSFDILVSLTGLIVASPIMLLIAWHIRRTSPGPAIFRQLRVGKNEVPFYCYKFRTMAFGTPDVGSHDASTSWITPTGQWLRAYKLDELPQLFNVLRGDMSLVGPRPCLPSQKDVVGARRQRNVFAVRPGITGPAQIAGIDMSMPDALARADRDYIDKLSLISDFRLLVMTVLGKGRGDAATRQQ